jgi:hypothetical protein
MIKYIYLSKFHEFFPINYLSENLQRKRKYKRVEQNTQHAGKYQILVYLLSNNTIQYIIK